jgi:hypothetical protein
MFDRLNGGTSSKLPLSKERAHVEIKTPDRHGAVRVSETQSRLADHFSPRSFFSLDVACKEISTKSHEHYLWIVSQIIFLPFCTEPDAVFGYICGSVSGKEHIGYVERFHHLLYYGNVFGKEHRIG